MAEKLKITLRRSLIGEKPKHRLVAPEVQILAV